MIKLHIADPEFIYDYFRNSPRRKEEGESWKEGYDDELPKSQKSWGYKFDQIEVFGPLDKAILIIGRTGDLFFAKSILIGRHQGVFRDLSVKLKEPYNQRKLIFVPSSPHGTGHLKKENGKVYASIMEAADGKVRDFGIGSNGSYGRVNPTAKDCFYELEGLMGITNTFIDVCLLENYKDPSQIPDLDLAFTR